MSEFLQTELVNLMQEKKECLDELNFVMGEFSHRSNCPKTTKHLARKLEKLEKQIKINRSLLTMQNLSFR